jgi:hypothetical protein
LWFFRVGFEPWYSDAPLAGVARWGTATLLGLFWGFGVAVGGIIVALFACGD